MIAKYGQSLLDLQLIAAGSLEGMKQLWDNNDLPITAELEDGQTLTMGDTADAMGYSLQHTYRIRKRAISHLAEILTVSA